VRLIEAVGELIMQPWFHIALLALIALPAQHAMRLPAQGCK
jgi:hypothetical protein